VIGFAHPRNSGPDGYRLWWGTVGIMLPDRNDWTMSNFAEIRAVATPIEIELRWSDQDINGHVNNVAILSVMEEARIRATQEWTATTPGMSGPPRIARSLNTNFDREVRYGVATSVWVWVPRVGTTSFVLGHLLVQDDRPCAYTEATMVVLDEATGRPKPHDDTFRKELERHAGPAYRAR